MTDSKPPWPNPKTCAHNKVKQTGTGTFCWICGAELVHGATTMWVAKYQGNKSKQP